MSQGTGQNELQEKTQKLLQGPLKHVRAAALAAALLPLASVVATPAAAEQSPTCSSGGICGFVWNDTNNNGSQDSGEAGIEGAKVSVSYELPDGTPDTIWLETGPDGQYYVLGLPPGPYTISVLITTGTPSPDNATNDISDSDGIQVGTYSTTNVDVTGPSYTDFGFYTAAAQGPGTGTPGYWKNHPEAWPLPGITIGAIDGAGGTYYLKADAIKWLGKVGKDKTTTMFSSLVSAMLNQKIGNEDSCVSGTIVDANKWMASHPVGSGVAGSSTAWAEGEPMHMLMDAYNNGLLCAKHRN